MSELERDRQAARIDERVDFADQAPARATHATGSKPKPTPKPKSGSSAGAALEGYFYIFTNRIVGLSRFGWRSTC
jgi:hypothetical protein